jgi:hypothetical protein
MEAPLTIPEKNEPLLEFELRTLIDGGQFRIDDLTGATVQWISKATKKTPDASGIPIVGTITNPVTNPVAVIQITAPVTATAGDYVYRVDVTLNGHPLTYRYGQLTIAST